jgi:hypothetical protein
VPREGPAASFPIAAEDRDEYVAETVSWVQAEARWSQIQARTKQSEIGKLLAPGKYRYVAEHMGADPVTLYRGQELEAVGDTDMRLPGGARWNAQAALASKREGVSSCRRCAMLSRR